MDLMMGLNEQVRDILGRFIYQCAKVNQRFCNILAQVVKVNNQAGQWEAELTWYSPDSTE